MKARHGYSLIECLFAITLVGTALSSVALMTHATRRADRRVRDAATAEADLGRLAAQLRSDAHQATSARIETPKKPQEPATTISLALPDDRQVDYTLLAQHAERVVRRGSAVLHRETYGLGASSSGKWLLREGGRSPVVSLLMEPAQMRSGGEFAAKVVRVDAAVHVLRSVARTDKR